MQRTNITTNTNQFGAKSCLLRYASCLLSSSSTFFHPQNQHNLLINYSQIIEKDFSICWESKNVKDLKILKKIFFNVVVIDLLKPQAIFSLSELEFCFYLKALKKKRALIITTMDMSMPGANGVTNGSHSQFNSFLRYPEVGVLTLTTHSSSHYSPNCVRMYLYLNYLVGLLFIKIIIAFLIGSYYLLLRVWKDASLKGYTCTHAKPEYDEQGKKSLGQCPIKRG